MTGADYDAFAEAYAADNENNAWNAHYERPAILELAGAATGLDVLDAGCGSGVHAEALIARGAKVTGIDKSGGMLAIAARRLGDRARLVQADLEGRLPFEDRSFDLVLASLVLHYLQDWAGPLSEFYRLLRPEGRLVFSTHHPFMDHKISGAEDYFETYRFADDWVRDGKTITMHFWHRPLHAMFDSLMAAGFRIDRLSEPMPDPRAEPLFPNAYRNLVTKPQFLFFVATKS